MLTNEIPSSGVECIGGHSYPWSIIITPDEWWIVSIVYERYGEKRLACGRGRNAKVALKFAIQALRRELKE